MSEFAWTMSCYTPECPLHWWDGDVGCRRETPQGGACTAMISISIAR